MSEITGGGSVVHGALVFLAAVVGIAGYLIRSRLNHIELQKKGRSGTGRRKTTCGTSTLQRSTGIVYWSGFNII